MILKLKLYISSMGLDPDWKAHLRGTTSGRSKPEDRAKLVPVLIALSII